MDGASYPQTTHAATDAFHLTDAKCKGMKKPFRVCPRRSLFRHHSPSCSPFYRPLLAPHSNSPGATFKLPWRYPQTTQALPSNHPGAIPLPHLPKRVATRVPRSCPTWANGLTTPDPTALPHVPYGVTPPAQTDLATCPKGMASREFGHSVKGVPDKGQSIG